VGSGITEACLGCFDLLRAVGCGLWLCGALAYRVSSIGVTEIESIVEPNRVADDVRWESVTLVCIHGPILSVVGF
jgi:hypothetical protein